MRKTMIVILLAIFALAMMLPALAVADEPEPPEGAKCVDLLAGQTLDVGDVYVWNDADNLYVKYVITEEDWCLTETHVHVGLCLDDFPRAGKQLNPVPGQFDYSACHDCVTEYTEVIPLGDWVAGDELIIAAHAVVSDAPKGQANGVIYGTRISDGIKGLYEIDVVGGTTTLLKAFTGGLDSLGNGTGYSNALAYDPDGEVLYFTAPSAVNVVPSPFWYYGLNTGMLGRPCVDSLEGSVVGASWYNGEYYYIAEGTNELMALDPASCDEPRVAASDFGLPGDFTFGDFAISSEGMLYGSTRIAPKFFFSLNLNNGDYCVFEGSNALDLQLAYGSNGKLYGVNHASGNFYEVDVTTGMATPLSLNAKGFADLASGELFVPCTETAWGAGERFTPRGNWATFFCYEVQPPCEFVESVCVPSDGSLVSTTNTLAEGQKYRFKASGTFTYNSAKDWADAEWYLKSGIIVKGDTEGSKPYVLDVSINGYSTNIDWGAYNSEHVYYQEFTGTGLPVDFSIYDSAYGDNAGSLSIDIYRVNW
jgi:hypothetical protein